MPITLTKPADFGAKILERYLAEGWGSLSKRDLDLLFFILLEQDGGLPHTASNYDIARTLRLTESKVAALRRDATARWRNLTHDDPKLILRPLIESCLEETRLEQTIKYATERTIADGFIAVMVEHPDDRAELEHAIIEERGIPVYERNRKVILLHYITLVNLAARLGALPTDAADIQQKLKAFIGPDQLPHVPLGALRTFLTTDVRNLTREGARAAINDAGCIVFEEGLKNLLPRLLRVILGH